MSTTPPGWRCTWSWSPPAVRPGRTAPSWKVYPTEAEARAKAAELAELARGTGATVAISITPEPATRWGKPNATRETGA